MKHFLSVVDFLVFRCYPLLGISPLTATVLRRVGSGDAPRLSDQRIRQDHFKDRALFYVSRLIQRLLRKGRETNSYKLPEVYLIGILEFSMDTGATDRYFHDIALMDKHTCKPFYNKLGFKFLEPLKGSIRPMKADKNLIN